MVQAPPIVESLTELAVEGLPAPPPRSSASSATAAATQQVPESVTPPESAAAVIEVVEPAPPKRVPVRAPGFPLPPAVDDDATVPLGMAIGLAVGGLATGFVVALGVLGRLGTRKV